MEETPEYQVDAVLEPTEQHTITFYGKPLIAVRLPDGTPAVVFNHLCKNMGLEQTAQVRRVRRKKALAKGLYSVRIETPGGPQVVNALTLAVTPGWLFDIDAARADPDKREEIEHYQERCMEVLYQWASAPHLETPTSLVPSEPVAKPMEPELGASPEQWRAYHRQMAEFFDWKISIEEWRGGIEGRIENIEALLPDIMERLPPATISSEHQNLVKWYVSELNKATHKPFPTIWSLVYTAFQVPRYQDLREAQWDEIQHWFRQQFQKVSRLLPGEEQGKLFE
jgi:hypothetical protein